MSRKDKLGRRIEPFKREVTSDYHNALVRKTITRRADPEAVKRRRAIERIQEERELNKTAFEKWAEDFDGPEWNT